MIPREDVSSLQALEEAVTGALTLTEGLGREELGRARLTREAVRSQLLQAARAATALSLPARAALSEIDCAAWSTTAERLDAGEAVDGISGWFAIQVLAPDTLVWLRFHRAQHPDWFAGALV